MRIYAGWIIAVVLACAPVLAQEMFPYSGAWHVAMVSKKGEPREGTVTLTDKDGSWDIEHQVFKDPCKGMSAPIVIQRATADELVFQIVRSRSLRGCQDNVATLKRVDDRTLQGELDDGRKLVLTR